MTRNAMILVLVLLLPLVGAQPIDDSEPPALRIVEIVADPQTDWNQDGRVTTSDEYIELLNEQNQSIDLTGWVLELVDTTPTTMSLAGSVGPKQRHVALNPPGALNNDATLRLLDDQGRLVHAVSYGRDSDGLVADANGQDALDEALTWRNDTWLRMHATPGAADGPWVVLAHDLDVVDTRWLAPPRATRTLTLEARSTFVDLSGLQIAGAEAVPMTGRLNQTTLAIELPDNGTVPLTAIIALGDGTSHSRPLGHILIDAQPPNVVRPTGPAWSRVSPVTIAWEAAQDAGIGGIYYELEWTSVGGSNGSGRLDEPGVQIPMDDDNHTVRLRARPVDAYENRANWSAWSIVGYDPDPPTAPPALHVRGDEQTTVSWSQAQDARSFIESYELARNGSGQVHTFEVGNVTTWTDPDSPRGGALQYAVRALDAAGNPSPWVTVEADHEALYPQFTGARVLKPAWSAGVQEMRFDFDRAMDPSVTPEVRLGTSLLPGRWLANSSTFYVKISDPQGLGQGQLVWSIGGAAAADGRRIEGLMTGQLRIDTTPPASSYQPRTGGFDVSDEQDSRPAVHYKAWRSTEATPAAYVAWNPGFGVLADAPPGQWRLRWFSVDDLGNREATQEATVTKQAPAEHDPPPSGPAESSAPAPQDRAAGDQPVVPRNASAVDNRSQAAPVPTDLGSVYQVGLAAEPPTARTMPALPWGLGVLGVASTGAVATWRRQEVVALWQRMRRRRAAPPPFSARLRKLREQDS